MTEYEEHQKDLKYPASRRDRSKNVIVPGSNRLLLFRVRIGKPANRNQLFSPKVTFPFKQESSAAHFMLYRARWAIVAWPSSPFFHCTASTLFCPDCREAAAGQFPTAESFTHSAHRRLRCYSSTLAQIISPQANARPKLYQCAYSRISKSKPYILQRPETGRIN